MPGPAANDGTGSGLIEKIVATPVPTKGKRMALDLTLHGNHPA